ncbi:MAG TPA: hypothetical protein VGB50_01915 [Flavobacterium sp.]|jgi:hypothetical protein
METLYPTEQSRSKYLLFGLLAFVAVSCGSYQNSSYYDRDGIYGSGDNGSRQSGSDSNAENNQYKDYFGALQKENPEIFTDVENYNSATDSTSNSTEGYRSGYSGWGSEADNVTVNVYGGNYWGYNYWNDYWYGPGWRYSWYGPYWNIGWNSWYGTGWGYNYYPYGYGYYGNGWYNGYHHHHYAYNGGRRGVSYNSGLRGENSSRYYSGGRRTYTQVNNGGTRSSSSNGIRTNTTPRNPNGVRSQSGGTRTNSYSTPRGNTNNNVRQSTPTRSYSPSPSYGGGTRSSGGSFGGGRSGGGRR